MKRIAFLVQLPKKVSPGQRFRIEQYEPILSQNGFVLETFSFIDEGTHKIIYKKGSFLKKASGVLRGAIQRFLFLFKAYKFDYIFLQREAAPLGPPVFEWILAKLLKKKFILDFDDAIWIPNTSEGNKLAHYIKCNWKVKYLCKWAYKVSVGNQYLYNYAAQYSKRVVLIPTCVDTNIRYNKIKEHKETNVVIGWTGSHSTLPYLNLLFPILEKLELQYEFEFLVICNKPPEFNLKSLKFMPWKEDTEIHDLLNFDIGVMPLIEDEWSEGKCGFKIIQYLSLGIPAVASPVGVNKVIIEEGRSGFLCNNDEEWYNALSLLIEDVTLRSSMGKIGREKILTSYSVPANTGPFISLFD